MDSFLGGSPVNDTPGMEDVTGADTGVSLVLELCWITNLVSSFVTSSDPTSTLFLPLDNLTDLEVDNVGIPDEDGIK